MQPIEDAGAPPVLDDVITPAFMGEEGLALFRAIAIAALVSIPLWAVAAWLLVAYLA